jgi:hypothetical protein
MIDHAANGLACQVIKGQPHPGWGFLQILGKIVRLAGTNIHTLLETPTRHPMEINNPLGRCAANSEL